MNTKELNLCEILKGWPKGIELYTPMYGVVHLHSIKEKGGYPIIVSDMKGCHHSFCSDGRIYQDEQAECCLFPSRDNRDWSTFKTKKERFDPKTLKPLDIYISNSKKDKNMKLNEYQEKAQETANYSRPNQFLAISYCSLGLTGEAGEVANKVKKIFRDDNGVCNPEKLRELMYEAGDCLWYIAILAKECGYTLEDVAQMNYEKLHSRAERGKIGGSGDHR